MLEILKRALAAIAKRWKILAWTLAVILLALTFAILIRKFPAVRIPATAVVVGIFLILLLWLFPKWQVRSIVGLDSKERFAHENEARQTLSQILGGLALLIGFYFTWQNLVLTREGQVDAEKAAQENLRMASEGQITDRFTKAISQLGDTKLEIRLGGIYALERIAKDSPKDHWSIMEVLTAYVREHAKITNPIPKAPLRRNAMGLAVLDEKELQKPPVDIQAILTVIGRRTLIDQEPAHLDLHDTDLRGVNFSKANLRGANLNGCNLTSAVLFDTSLPGARLRGAILRGVNAGGVDLSGASLNGADLTVANLTGADLTNAEFAGVFIGGTNEQFVPADLTEVILSRAVLKGTILYGVNLSGADFRFVQELSPDELEKARGDSATKLPPNIPRPKSWH